MKEIIFLNAIRQSESINLNVTYSTVSNVLQCNTFDTVESSLNVKRN